MGETNEQRADRFKRLATKRTNIVLDRIRVLGNCANRGAYEYSEADISKIFSEIDPLLKETKAKFHFAKNKEFKL